MAFSRFARFTRKFFSKKYRLIAVLILLVVIGIGGYWWKVHSRFPVAPLTAETVKAGLPHYLYTIDGRNNSYNPANSGNSLKGPLAVAVSADRVFVADTGHSQVQVYSRNGKWVATWGYGKLNYPFALTFSNNMLYVADSNLMELFVFDAKGNEQKPLLNKQRLQLTTGKQGEIIRPTAVQVGANNLMYVADVGNQVVLVMDTSGKILRYFGGAGTTAGKFQYPNALYVGKNDTVYVSDSNNGRIQIFDQQGHFLSKITGSQGKNGPLALPRGLAVTDSGFVLVVDVFMHSVRAYDETGSELWTFGGMGSGNGQFNFPNGLCVDTDGRIYITDRENNRVQVFGY
ncbi:6-bladed beta-propeller [Desulfosporosinus sp. OT]|uniref:6-bladed beta-propeller n=1 Tax=Desulfosporosinus sp. OT TaxID=913865 RepID=UPI000223AF43|nr:6-bladed beta-propeller [Desulfosporosinus sp. OT]EGW38227.1 NHL repeat family protein [Desulfosporosinus sp. OT]